jgi:hypothetical protein
MEEKTMTILDHVIRFDYPGYMAWYWIAGVVGGAALLCLLSYLGEVFKREDWSPWEALRRTTKGIGTVEFAVRMPLWCLVGFLGLVALSEPYEENSQVEIPEGHYSGVIAGDVSASSFAEYYRNVFPTEALADGTHPAPVGPWGSNKQMMLYLADKKILASMPGNRFGLVAFTGTANAVSGLREDYAYLRRCMKRTEYFNSMGGGSDPAEGLKTAVQILAAGVEDEKDLQRKQIIFLFTDGGITDIEPDPKTKQVNEKDKQVWERDFGRTLTELEGLKKACIEAGGQSPEVVLIGLGGDVDEMVPLYFVGGLRVRDQQTGELLWFPRPGTKADEAPKTHFNDANFKMLQTRINAVVPCKSIRIPLDWAKIQQIDWKRDFIGGTKTAIGRHYWTPLPLTALMIIMIVLFVPAILHTSDAVVRRAPRHNAG